MKHNILCGPSYSLLEVALEPTEKIVTEAGAMAWMSSNMQSSTNIRGGMMAGLKRKLLTGESLMQNTYEPQGGPGMIGVAPGVSGDIVHHEMNGGELLLEKGAYLASGPDVHCDSKWDGLKGFFNEGLFILRCTGQGPLFFNAYGDVEAVQVNGSYTVDNGYAVAWEPTLQYTLTKARKISSFFFGDQIVLQFTGSGKLWIQSRSPRSLANWVTPFRPVQSN